MKAPAKKETAFGYEPKAADATIPKRHYILIEIIRIIQYVPYDVILIAIVWLIIGVQIGLRAGGASW